MRLLTFIFKGIQFSVTVRMSVTGYFFPSTDAHAGTPDSVFSKRTLSI